MEGKPYALAKWQKRMLEAQCSFRGWIEIVPHVTPLMLVQERMKKFSKGNQLTLDL